MVSGHILPFLCLAYICSGTSGLRCHQCTGVTNPKYCAMSVLCGADEECYTEQILGEGSDVFYNAGCQKVKVCQAVAKGRRSSLHICEGCCGTDLCNVDTCSNSNVTSTPGATCYKCSDVSSPLDCHTRVACAQGEQCIVTQYLNDQLETRFNLGCETKSRCDILQQYGKRGSLEICNECCHSSGCNRHLCIEDGNGTLTASSATTLPTSTVSSPGNSSCADAPDVNCTMFDKTSNICARNAPAAKKLCPLYCGLCSVDGSTRPSTTPVTGSTEDPCKDSEAFDCKDMDDRLHICQQKTAPPTIQYCPKYCGLC